VILGVEHVAIMTTDIERAQKFYTEVLGFQQVSRYESPEVGTMINLELNGTRIELFGGGTPREAPSEEDKVVGLVHLALGTDDVDEECARLKGLGVPFEVEPTTSRFSGNRLAFFRDPDGNRLELVKRPE